MTKQDFELIAATLRHSYAFDEGNTNVRATLAADFASALASTNSRFNRARFIAACMGEDSTDSAGRKVRYSDAR
jgi:hypothetical protein